MNELRSSVTVKILVVITSRPQAKKVSLLLDTMHVPLRYQLQGRGTASSELLEIYGLDGTTRIITLGVIRGESTESVFQALEKAIQLKKKGRGIAFTIPINGAQTYLIQQMSEERRQQIEDYLNRKEAIMSGSKEYVVIIVTCRQGFSEQVMDAARDAGASGGTILKGRQCTADASVHVLGISIQEEREIVAILIPRSRKRKMLETISKSCGMHTEARSTILSLPVDEIVGAVF